MPLRNVALHWITCAGCTNTYRGRQKVGLTRVHFVYTGFRCAADAQGKAAAKEAKVPLVQMGSAFLSLFLWGGGRRCYYSVLHASYRTPQRGVFRRNGCFVRESCVIRRLCLFRRAEEATTSFGHHHPRLAGLQKAWNSSLLQMRRKVGLDALGWLVLYG